MGKKNILVFNFHSFPLSATFIYRQIKAATAEHNIHLVTMEVSNEDNFPLQGITRWVIKYYYGLADRLMFYFQKRLYKYPLKFSRQAIHKLIAFTKMHNIDMIHVHYGTWAVHLLPFLTQVKVPIIVSFHGYDASSALKKKESYAMRLPELFNFVSKIIIVSEHMRKPLNLLAWFDKVVLVPYGIDTTVFARKTTKLPAMDIKILHSGRITPKKGLPDLIRVFSELKKRYQNISLHILGDGAEMEVCQMLTKELNLIHAVTFYGSQPLEDVIRLMSECDIFVLNSRIADDGDMEGLPNSVLEAMSMEMAVVSTHHAGIPMAIKDHENGLLVPERDNNSLKEAIGTLIVNYELRSRFGTEARNTILRKFTNHHMNSKLLSLYDSLG